MTSAAHSPGPQVRTRREEAAEAIRRAIISGDLQPGQRLREVALAGEVGVSRPTLREALRTLVQEGLCEQEPHRGFAVASLDDQAIRDLAETRLVLDRMAIEGIWAAGPDGGGSADSPGYADSGLVGMAAVDAAWSAYVDADSDPVSQHLAHLALHRALWQASGNSMLMRMWPVAESMSTLVLAHDQAVRRDPGRALAVHASLIEAIRSRDPEALDAAMAEHTRRSAEEFLTLRSD
ncbi:MAG: GntR family transcriptional regulator [Actinobacteria bacterium]|nr:GntR family transcriptional regulator [Actinomycetota bacterium]